MQMLLRSVLLLVLAVATAGCRGAGSTAPVVKIGVLAPFEGAYREFGYHLLPATRLALQEAQRSGDLSGVRVEWVVLDTHGDPEIAARRARELAVDPDVVAIVGPALPGSVAAALPVLRAAGIPAWPLVAAETPPVPESPVVGSAAEAAVVATGPEPSIWFYVDAAPPDPVFAAAYRALTGQEPWPLDAAAYRAGRAALRSLSCRAGAACSADWRPSAALYRGTPGRFPGELVRVIDAEE